MRRLADRSIVGNLGNGIQVPCNDRVRRRIHGAEPPNNESGTTR